MSGFVGNSIYLFIYSFSIVLLILLDFNQLLCTFIHR